MASNYFLVFAVISLHSKRTAGRDKGSDKRSEKVYVCYAGYQ